MIGPDTSGYTTAMTINIGGTFGLFCGSQPSGSLERGAGTTGTRRL